MFNPNWKSPSMFKRWQTQMGYKDDMAFYTPNNKTFGGSRKPYNAPSSPFDVPGQNMGPGSGIAGERNVGADNFNADHHATSSTNPYKNGTLHGGGGAGVLPGETPNFNTPTFGNLWKPKTPGQVNILSGMFG